MRVLGVLALAAATAGLAGSATGQTAAPTAVYWMSAQTTSGFMAGAMSGGRPSPGAMMGMMMGRGGGAGANHTLTLQLGSQRRAPAPSAEHAPPAGLGAGQILPLVTPRQATAAPREEPEDMPRDFERPRGRMLIYWGCGDRARPGQPLVIDFAQVAEGQIPPGLAALGKGLGLTPMRPPSPGRNATYGEWPNERVRATVPPDGSLVGEHLVRGNYTPDIRFSLGPNQDFLAPLVITANDTTPAGSSMLGWRTVPGARAYLATLMGGGRNDTVVMWTSSEVQASAFAMPDYLGDGDITRLVGTRALMGPQATSCLIPREVVDAVDGGMLQLAAYGGEANFAYPPRPADPKAKWTPEWTVKVRYRSAAGAILGMSDMGGMNERGPPRRGQPTPQKPGVGGILRGLGGF